MRGLLRLLQGNRKTGIDRFKVVRLYIVQALKKAISIWLYVPLHQHVEKGNRIFSG